MHQSSQSLSLTDLSSIGRAPETMSTSIFPAGTPQLTAYLESLHEHSCVAGTTKLRLQDKLAIKLCLWFGSANGAAMVAVADTKDDVLAAFVEDLKKSEAFMRYMQLLTHAVLHDGREEYTACLVLGFFPSMEITDKDRTQLRTLLTIGTRGGLFSKVSMVPVEARNHISLNSVSRKWLLDEVTRLATSVVNRHDAGELGFSLDLETRQEATSQQQRDAPAAPGTPTSSKSGNTTQRAGKSRASTPAPTPTAAVAVKTDPKEASAVKAESAKKFQKSDESASAIKRERDQALKAARESNQTKDGDSDEVEILPEEDNQHMAGNTGSQQPKKLSTVAQELKFDAEISQEALKKKQKMDRPTPQLTEDAQKAQKKKQMMDTLTLQPTEDAQKALSRISSEIAAETSPFQKQLVDAVEGLYHALEPERLSKIMMSHVEELVRRELLNMGYDGTVCNSCQRPVINQRTICVQCQNQVAQRLKDLFPKNPFAMNNLYSQKE